jgi:hypothetical protein
MSATAAATTEEMVTIPAARLRELEAIEAKQKTYMGKLSVLHEKRKANPAKHSKKVLEKYHANKEEINARRRAAYKAKKAASSSSVSTSSSTE